MARGLPTSRGPRGSLLDTQFNEAARQGGGIQAGAHPEFEGLTPLDRVVAGFKKFFGKKEPQTMNDKSGNVVRTSDLPVSQIGQGIQGNRHSAAGTGSGVGGNQGR